MGDRPRPDQHKLNPVCFRPPEADRAWLYAHAEAAGRPVGSVLSQALREYRARAEAGEGGTETPAA